MPHRMRRACPHELATGAPGRVIESPAGWPCHYCYYYITLELQPCYPMPIDTDSLSAAGRYNSPAYIDEDAGLIVFIRRQRYMNRILCPRRLRQHVGQLLSRPLVAVELPVDTPLRIEHHGAEIVDKTAALVGKTKVELRNHQGHHVGRSGRKEPAIRALPPVAVGIAGEHSRPVELGVE